MEILIRNTFKAINSGIDPLIDDCKTNVCIPIYDLEKGKPSVVKSRHHLSFQRDYHIPAYQVALATSAAPTYFDPYTVTYKDSLIELKTLVIKSMGELWLITQRLWD